MARNGADLQLNIFGNSQGAERAIKNTQSAIIRLVGAIASLNAAFRTISFPIQSAIEFEGALADVQKTTGFTSESIGELSGELVELSRQTGIAATDLAQVAAAAGQLGLGDQGREAIVAFTDTVSRFATVTDISVDQAATSIAQITNILQLPIDQAERVSATFNELSNTTVATGEQLLDISRRVGSAGGLLEFAETAALAAASLEFGQRPEVAGTALTKAFSNARANAEDFAVFVNQSTDEWVENLETNGVGALQELFLALSELDGQARDNAIRDLFGTGRQFSFISRFVDDAANGFAILGEALATSNRAFAEGTSAIDEFNIRAQATDVQLARTQANLRALAIEAGEVLTPAFREALLSLRQFASDPDTIQRVRDIAENISDVARAVVQFGSAIGTVLPDIETLLTLLTAFIGVSIFRAIAGGLLTATAAFARFGTVVNRAQGILNITGVQAIAVAAGLTRAAAGARTAAGAFTVLGRALFAFTVSNPITAALAGGVILLASLDPVREFYGRLIGSATEGGEELVDAINESREEAEGALTRFIEGIDVLANAVGNAVNIDLTTQVGAQLEQAITSQLRVLARATAQINEARDGGIRAAAQRVQDIRSEIAAVEREIRSLQPVLAQDAGVFNAGEIQQAGFRLAQLRDQAALLNGRLASAVEGYNLVAEAARNAEAQQRGALEQLAQIIDQNTAAQLSGIAELAAAEAELQALQQQRTTLDTEQRDGGSATGAEQLDSQILQLQARIRALRVEAEQSRRALEQTFGGQQLLAAIEGQERAFLDALNALRRNEQGNRDLQGAVTGVIDELIIQIQQLDELEARASAFQAIRDEANLASRSINAIFDNLPQRIAAVTRQIGVFLRELSEIPAERTVRLRIEENFDERLEDIDSDLERQQARIDRLIIQANRIQNPRLRAQRIAQLERERERLEGVADARRRDNEVLRQNAQLQARLAAAQDRLRESNQRLADIERGLIAARELTGQEQADEILRLNRLREQELETNRRAAQELQATTREFAEFGGRVSETEQALRGLPDAYIRTQAEITAATQAAEDLLNRSLEAEVSLAREAQATATALDETVAELEALENQVGTTEQRISALKDQLGLTDEQFRAIRTSVLALRDSLVDDLNPALEAIRRILNDESLGDGVNAAQEAIAARFTENSVFEEQIRQAIEDGASSADINEALQSGVEAAPLELPPAEADVELEQGQVDAEADSLNPVTIEGNVEIRDIILPDGTVVQGASQFGGQNFAEGGAVRGPGTGTSDSIPAWLSNGEYVIDAATTRRFGAGFFAGLQRMGRLPRFASGGFVGVTPAVTAPSSIALPDTISNFLQSTAGGDVVTLRLDLGDEEIELRGDRADVDKLQTTLRNVRRGGIR